MYTVTYIDMSHSECTDERATLEAARSHVTYLEEHGAQCISITDPDGNEVE